MSGHRTVRAIAVAAGALLCSAVVAASAVERPSAPTADGRVGAAGVSQSPLVDEPSTTVTTVAVTTVAAPTTTLPPPTTRTTAPRSTTTTPILPPGAPLPPIPNTPVTGIPNAPPASSWQGEGQGVTLRLRIEPATPVAGQAARFVIDVATSDPCCTVLLDFGDGSAGWTLNNSRSCEPSTLLKRGPFSVSTAHTYAAPGAYKATLSVFTGDSCTNPPLAPGAAPPPPFLGAANVTACIGVGPGTAAQQGCSPFPTFGPDSIISPVLDPFCQVRSDCTQASPPR